MSKLRYFGILILLLWAIPAMSQKGLSRQAQKKYVAHNFEKAASLWQKAFTQSKEEEEKRRFAFQTGLAYSRMNKFSESLQWFNTAIGHQDAPTEWLLSQADVMLKTGNLDGAREVLDKVLAADRTSSEAKQMLQFIQNYEATRRIQWPVIHEAVKLNTTSSDYSASWLNSDLVISSSRDSYLSRQKDGRTSESYSALFLSIENLYGDFAPAIPLPIGKNRNIGVFTFDPVRKLAYYTRCNNNKGRCLIEVCSFDPVTFVFGKGKPAGFVNKKQHYGHPFLSPDGSKLFFSASLPGGFGGNDIYSISILPDGSWGVPENAGSLVNTPFDELFPTLLGDSILVFSTEGFKNGFGGLDLVAVDIGATGYSNPRVLLPPFNSGADDFSLSMRSDGSKGIFTSNRTTGRSDDLYFFDDYPLRNILRGTVATRDSIGLDSASVHCTMAGREYTVITDSHGHFAVSVPEKSKAQFTVNRRGYYPEKMNTPAARASDNPHLWILLSPTTFAVSASGLVTERSTGLPMEGELVELIMPVGEIASTRTDHSGHYLFEKLQQDRIYTVRISGPGIFTESRVIRVPDLRQDIILQKANGYDLDFELTRIREKEEVTLKDIYYDFDKADLREASKIELQKLASMLRETPGVSVQIASHTDGRGTDAYNDRLSQERAQSVVDYLVASGIHPSRLIAKGYGKQQMIFKNATDESQHQANRRTTFQVISYDQTIHDKSFTKTTETKQDTPAPRLIFRVQLLVSANRYDPETYFSALSTVIPDIRIYVQENEKLYRYEAGDRHNLSEAEALRNLIRSAGFADSFIVPYLDGQRVSMQQAKEFKNQ